MRSFVSSLYNRRFLLLFADKTILELAFKPAVLLSPFDTSIESAKLLKDQIISLIQDFFPLVFRQECLVLFD